MRLHLYHHNSSVCAAKVRIALAEKGLAWDGTLMTLKGDQFDWLEDVVLFGAESRTFRQAIACTDALLDDFERRLGTSDWLTGDRHSLSDVAFTPYLARLDLLGFDALFDDRPRLGGWYGRLCSRDSAREVFDWYQSEYRQMLKEKGRDVAMHLASVLSGLRNSVAPAVGVDTARGHR